MTAAFTTEPGASRGVLPRFAQSRATLTIVGLVVGAAIWEVLGLTHVSRFLPPIHSVFARVIDLWRTGQLRQPLTESVRNLVIGYAFSATVGVLIGTLMAVSKYVDYALRVYVNALMATPSILLVPVLYVIWGLSSFTLIAVIVLYTTVFVVANTRTAVSGARHDLSEMAKAFGAGATGGFFGVTLRSAGPEIFAGLRLGMGRAVKGMFNGELLIAVVGLAHLDRTFAGAFDATGILAIALVILMIAVILTGLLEFVNRTLNSWALGGSQRPQS